MDPMLIGLIVLTLLIVVFNFGYMAKSKKNRKAETIKYASALSVLVKNEKKLGGEGSYLAARFRSEDGNNFIICKSTTNGSKAIVTEKTFHFIKDGDTASCDIIADEDSKGRIAAIRCRVSSNGAKVVTVDLTDRAHGKNSPKTNMFMGIAKDFQREVLR